MNIFEGKWKENYRSLFCLGRNEAQLGAGADRASAPAQLGVRFAETGVVMEYRVLAAIRDDLNQGWVWVTNSGLDSRSVVKITNKKNGKSVYCECLEIDDNYLLNYNNPPSSLGIGYRVCYELRTR